MLIVATALGLGAFKADDPVVVLPMLAISCAAFIALCYYHHGAVLVRAGASVVFICALVLVGWRDLRPRNEAPPVHTGSVSAPSYTQTETKKYLMTPEQKKAITKAMRPYKRIEVIVSCRECGDGHPDAWQYAVDLSNALHDAGMVINGPHLNNETTIPPGVFIYRSDDRMKSTTALLDVLRPMDVLASPDSAPGAPPKTISVSIMPPE